MSMYKIVFIRHGQSQWNKENRFTGWKDVDLSQQGIEEAQLAAKLLKEEGLEFDKVYTSVLTRAIRTAWIVMAHLDRYWLPVERSWRLNERHYGALQGLNKAETVQKHGKDQVFIWRRSYDIPPPPMEVSDERHPCHDPRYKELPKDLLPSSESLKDTLERVLPYWQETLAKDIRNGKRLLVVAHGNSIRALVKHLDNVSEDEISEVNIPTGIPLVYELDADLRPVKHYYLGDPELAAKEAEKVARQTEA